MTKICIEDTETTTRVKHQSFVRRQFRLELAADVIFKGLFCAPYQLIPRDWLFQRSIWRMHLRFVSNWALSLDITHVAHLLRNFKQKKHTGLPPQACPCRGHPRKNQDRSSSLGNCGCKQIERNNARRVQPVFVCLSNFSLINRMRQINWSV
jgi:hypothetical protein